jgi:hypothetical protein
MSGSRSADPQPRWNPLIDDAKTLPAEYGTGRAGVHSLVSSAIYPNETYD